MTCSNENIQVQWQEDGTAYVLSRVIRKDSNHNLVPIQQSNLTSVIRKVLRTLDGATVIGPDTLVIANVILDTLSTGDIWTQDELGFNFIDAVPPTAFPEGGIEYEVEYKFTLTSGEVFWLKPRGVAVETLFS